MYLWMKNILKSILENNILFFFLKKFWIFICLICIKFCFYYLIFLYYQVISGHIGWVRCLAVEPGNEWFVSGAGDRVIKVIHAEIQLKNHITATRGRFWSINPLLLANNKSMKMLNYLGNMILSSHFMSSFTLKIST